MAKTAQKRHFGAHVSASGGFINALTAAQQLAINTIQIHPSPPQRWNTKPFAKGVEDEFVAGRAASGVEKVFFHAIYLINLANPDPQKLQLSKLSLLHDLDLCARLSGDGVIVHVGSMKDQPDEEAGYRQVAGCIDWVLDQYKGNPPLILEVAAGSGQVIGDRMEELRRIYDLVSDKQRVGFGLDSQHMWASGYDMRDDLDGVVREIESVFTLDKVYAFHLNDSKVERGSHVDRHENLGDGKIGLDGIRRIVNHPQLLTIPFILETPGLKEPETAKIEVEKLRALIG